jgi:hypothetical protein
MLMAPRQCMDCPIFIYDESNNLITETVVTGYGKNEMYIEISEGLEEIAPGTRLRLVVIHADNVSEFAGKLTSVRQGIFEISIHGQLTRDARGASRFSFNIPGTISTFLVNQEVVKLMNPIHVTIKNISSTGLMIESKDLPLNEGVSLNVEFQLNGRNSIILSKVVRTPTPESEPNCFGCQILFPS